MTQLDDVLDLVVAVIGRDEVIGVIAVMTDAIEALESSATEGGT